MLTGCVGSSNQSLLPGGDCSLRLLPYRDPLRRLGNPHLLQLYRINTLVFGGWLISIRAYRPPNPRFSSCVSSICWFLVPCCPNQVNPKTVEQSVLNKHLSPFFFVLPWARFCFEIWIHSNERLSSPLKRVTNWIVFFSFSHLLYII